MTRQKVPNVLSPRDLVFRPDNMDETVPHTKQRRSYCAADQRLCFRKINEPRGEKTGFLHLRKQRRRSASR